MLRALTVSLPLVVASGGFASAAPHLPSDKPDLPIVLAANGCGPGFFRTIAGNCVPNARVVVGGGRAMVLPPPCPRGFRRDPNPARPICYPIF